MDARALSAATLALIIGAATPAVAQVTPATDQPVTSLTIIGDTDANKSLAWL